MKITKEGLIKKIDNLISNSEEIYKSKTLEDCGQLINQSGEMEVLDIINLIKEFRENIKTKA